MESAERVDAGADAVGEFEQAVHNAACVDASDEDGGFVRVGAGDERDGLGLRHRGGARKCLAEQAVRRRDVNVQRCGGVVVCEMCGGDGLAEHAKRILNRLGANQRRVVSYDGDAAGAGCSVGEFGRGGSNGCGGELEEGATRGLMGHSESTVMDRAPVGK